MVTSYLLDQVIQFQRCPPRSVAVQLKIQYYRTAFRAIHQRISLSEEVEPRVRAKGSHG